MKPTRLTQPYRRSMARPPSQTLDKMLAGGGDNARAQPKTGSRKRRRALPLPAMRNLQRQWPRQTAR